MVFRQSQFSTVESGPGITVLKLGKDGPIFKIQRKSSKSEAESWKENRRYNVVKTSLKSLSGHKIGNLQHQIDRRAFAIYQTRWDQSQLERAARAIKGKARGGESDRKRGFSSDLLEITKISSLR